MNDTKSSPGFDFIVQQLEVDAEVDYATVRAAAEEAGLSIYPIMYGRAKAKLGLVQVAPRGSKKNARQNGVSHRVADAASVSDPSLEPDRGSERSRVTKPARAPSAPSDSRANGGGSRKRGSYLDDFVPSAARPAPVARPEPKPELTFSAPHEPVSSRPSGASPLGVTSNATTEAMRALEAVITQVRRGEADRLRYRAVLKQILELIDATLDDQ